MKQKFYKCAICGQIITKVKETPVSVMCCGQQMQEMIAGTTDASKEKHVPLYTINNNFVKVDVGQVEHPMTNEHYIEWVSLQTNNGSQIKYLTPNTKPVVEFAINKNDTVISVYAYCNLHGLWMS